MSVLGGAKNAAGVVAGLAVILGIIAISAALLVGVAAFSFWVLKWTYPAFFITLAVTVLVITPLALIPPTRMVSALGFMFASFAFGAIVWLWGMAYTYSVWGFIGVFIGLALGGVGLVPVAMLAALFHGDWGNLALFVITTVLAIGTRALAYWLEQKAIERTARLRRSEVDAPAYRVE